MTYLAFYQAAAANLPFYMLGESHAVLALVSAELFLLLCRRREITILSKRDVELTAAEKKEKHQGLLRSVMLEAFLFVPASLFLFLVVVRPLLTMSRFGFVFATEPVHSSTAGFMGVVSYQFPFAAVRRVITQSALHTLQRFASIAIHPEP